MPGADVRAWLLHQAKHMIQYHTHRAEIHAAEQKHWEGVAERLGGGAPKPKARGLPAKECRPAQRAYRRLPSTDFHEPSDPRSATNSGHVGARRCGRTPGRGALPQVFVCSS